MLQPGGASSARVRTVGSLQDESGRLLADDDAGRHRVADGHVGEDGRICDPQVPQATNPKVGINHGVLVLPHRGRSALVPEGDEAVAEEAFQRLARDRARSDLPDA